jgi:hypothetical protein
MSLTKVGCTQYIINLGPEISTIQTKHLTQNIDDLERNKLTSKE